MRVLFVEELRGYGGAERYVEHLTGALRDLGVEPRVVAFAVDRTSGERHARRLAERGVEARLLERRFARGALRAEIARFGPALLHWSFPHPFAFAAGAALLVPWRCPLVVTEHLPNLGERRRWELLRAFANRGVAAMIVVSEAARAAAVAKWPGLAPRITTIANGVPLCPGARVAERAARLAALPAEPPVLLFIGRLEEQKNPGFALDVLAALRRAGTCARLIMVGDGSLAARLHAQARALGSDVEWTGFADDPQPLLARAHLLLVPSAYESGLSLASLDALGAGVPVLASDIPAHRGAAATRAVALLPVGDASRWAEAAASMARRSSELAAEARAVAERFSAAAMAAATLTVYSGVFARVSSGDPDRNPAGARAGAARESR